MSFQTAVFGGGPPSQIFYNKGVSKNLNYLGNQFQGDDQTYQNALSAFNAANAATTAKMQANAAQAGTDYNNLYQQNAAYNPLDTYGTIRSGNLAALKDWSGQLEGAGSAQDKLAMAAMGMGGTPDSSYASILRADRVSKNLAPVLGNIMSSLGSDTATIGDQRNQNLANSENLINLRTNAPMIGYGMQLDPANALQAVRGNQIGQLGDEANVAKTNSAGFQSKPGIMDDWDRTMQSIGRTASAAESVEGAVSGTGGATGGAGGGGGGTNMPPLGQITPGAGQNSMAPSSMSSGSSGMNMNTIMSIIKMMQGGQSSPMGVGQSSMQSPYLQQQYDPWSNYGGTNGTQNYYDTVTPPLTPSYA